MDNLTSSPTPRSGHGHQLNPEAQSFALSGPLNVPSTRNNEPRVRRFRNVTTGPPGTTVPIAQRASSAHLRSDQIPEAIVASVPPHLQRPHAFPLGTREDVELEDYQSPLATMFGTYYNRYQTAEQVRREVAAADGVPASAIRTMNFSQHQLGTETRDNHVSVGQPLYPSTNIQLGYPALYRTQHPAAPIQAPQLIDFDSSDDGHESNAVDRQEARPRPLELQEMMVNIACKMCMEQKIDTLIEPCMHLAMCHWCSEVWRENSRNLRQTDPFLAQPWKCPVCRRPIHQVRRVYF